MSRNKDLIVQHYQGSEEKAPLVLPLSRFEEQMYNEMRRMKKQMKAIKQILEVK